MPPRVDSVKGRLPVIRSSQILIRARKSRSEARPDEFERESIALGAGREFEVTDPRIQSFAINVLFLCPVTSNDWILARRLAQAAAVASSVARSSFEMVLGWVRAVCVAPL